MIITPKTRVESNRDYALRIIRDNIVNMEIEPGSLIGEQEIASQIGCSRTPVHEAFLELSKSRILDVLPQKGCRVAMIDYALITEARFLRKVVETALAEEACEAATAKDIEDLEVNVNLQKFYMNNDNAKLMALDNEFHEIIYRACHKLPDHESILNAIKSKDKEAARAAVEKHMARFDMDWEVIKKEYGEYIED